MSRARIVTEFVATRWLRRDRSATALQRRQARLLRRHIAFLRAQSPYFADLPASARLEDLPEMDKSVMMAHFDELNTLGVHRADAEQAALSSELSRDFTQTLHGASVGLSSGTSGHRGLFVVSPAERDAWAGTMLARTLPRPILGHRIALFLRADNTLYETVASRAVRFAYFDVYADMAENIAQLAEYAPSILVAPPSVLLVLGEARASGRLPIRPARVYAVAEVLEPTDEVRLRVAFGVEVIHQIYQCTEGFLGATCDAGVMHLNEDAVIVEREMLDERRFVPIVTDVRRRAQPIVRYRLGDVLRLREGSCPCGSARTAIDRIEGREGDTLWLPGDDGMVRVFADLVARAMVHAEGFGEYRVVQTSAAVWEVALDVDAPAVHASVRAAIERLATRLGANPPTLRFVPYAHDPAVKLRRIQCVGKGE